MAYKLPPQPFPDADNPDGFGVWVRRFSDHLASRNYSEATIIGTNKAMRYFTNWVLDRGIERPEEVTKPILERYQRWLFHYRNPSGKPLTFSSQRQRLQKIKNFYKWLARQNVITINPAADLEMPRVERRLPRAILTRREIDKVFTLPDITDPFGFRDRTMMEVLYSTGIRRHELASLELFDVNKDDRTLSVRLGKGKKDRIVPIGRRALDWVQRYVFDTRSELILHPNETILFVGANGEPFDLEALTQLMRVYIRRARLGKNGACHIFRHSMATHMLEAGADLRHIQEILGHADTSTTSRYTRVSIKHLRLVHEATHPKSDFDSNPAPSPVRINIVDDDQRPGLHSTAPEQPDPRQLELFPGLASATPAPPADDVQSCLLLLAAEQDEEDASACR